MNPALASLLCGYSQECRAAKVFVMFTAYFDDSASEQDERLFVLAGYVHSAESWLAFSDDWQAALDAHPRIEYLHMVEAENLRGPFKGWSHVEKDRKVDAMASVIAKYAPWSIECSVSRSVFEKILKPTTPYEIRGHYFPCFYAVIIRLAQMHVSMGHTLPIDFIFDEHGAIGAEAAVWYEAIKSMQSPEVSRVLGSSPIFRDDVKVLPLQAADLLAWHLRRMRERRNQNEQRPVVDKLLPLLHGKLELTPDMLADLAEQMSRVPNIGLTLRKPRK